MLLQIIFWFIVFCILHSYLFYPLILWIITLNRNDNNLNFQESLPTVSLVISVYNEEKNLPAKLTNIQTYDYPRESIEILFGTDGVTDKSEQILRDFSQINVKVVSFKNRRGKASVLNDLISIATGDIIVFTDANTIFEQKTVSELIKNFNNPYVGAVSGNLILRSNENGSKTAEYCYWVLENRLKLMESKSNSLLGATGGVYAIRKKLFTPLPTCISIADDFLIPMQILKKGYRTIYEPLAHAYEELEASIYGDYRRKVRIGAQNINVLPLIAPLLHPRFGFTAFSLWSHKILRWLVPFFLLMITLLLYLLKDISFCYEILYEATLIFWGIGLLGLVADLFKVSIGYLKYPFYFFAMNFALFVGTFKSILGLQKPTWPVVR